MGKGCQYHLEIQCANQVRIKWGSTNVSYFSFFFFLRWMSKVAGIVSFISLPTTWHTKILEKVLEYFCYFFSPINPITFSHFRCSFYLFDRWLCFQLRLGPYFFASYKAHCSLYITHDTGKEDLFGNQQLLELEAISFILMTVKLN